MMRGRGGDKKPCTYCDRPTVFERQLVGPRGGLLGWESCCIDCGEQSGRRAEFAKKKKPKAEKKKGKANVS